MEHLNAVMEIPGNEFTLQSLAATAILVAGITKATDAWDWASDKYKSRKK